MSQYILIRFFSYCVAMTHTITHKNIYNQLKAIFDGCDTIIDAQPFGNQYIDKYPHMKSIINSYMNGRTYRDIIDIKTKQYVMREACANYSHDDAMQFISKQTSKTTDDVYIKTLERIVSNRSYCRKENIIKEQINYVSKKCPHCSHILNMPELTQYIICGYHNSSQGYDWSGCGRDWCFQCEKKLCKRWEIDALCLQMNRYHDEECCIKHAQENGKHYSDEYCQCNNTNVLRSFTLINMLNDIQ